MHTRSSPKLGPFAGRRSPRLPVFLFFLVALLSSTAAFAECPAGSKWCDGFSVGLAPTGINLKTGAILTSVQVGPCIGITYQPIHFGADFCANLQVATKDTPNTYLTSVIFHWRTYGGLGIGALCQQRSTGDGLYCQMVALLSARVPVVSW